MKKSDEPTGKCPKCKFCNGWGFVKDRVKSEHGLGYGPYIDCECSECYGSGMKPQVSQPIRQAQGKPEQEENWEKELWKLFGKVWEKDTANMGYEKLKAFISKKLKEAYDRGFKDGEKKGCRDAIEVEWGSK